MVLRWAQVNAIAARNAAQFSSMTETERIILNMEYMTAYRSWEIWRRKHIERFDQDERIEAHIDSLPERERRWVRILVDEKRAVDEYDWDLYRDDLNGFEAQCASTPYYPGVENDKWWQNTTWRNGPNDLGQNSVANSKVTPRQSVEAFRVQVAATRSKWEERGKTLTAAWCTKRSYKHHRTDNRFLKDIALDDARKARKIEKERLRKLNFRIDQAFCNRVPLPDVPGVQNPALFLDMELVFGGYVEDL